MRHDDGSVTIIDYKTGTAPSKKSVEAGRSTQMLIEAALIANGGYQTITKGADIKALTYWKLQGRGHESGTILDVMPKGFAPEGLLENVSSLLARFEDPEMAYHAEPDPRGRQRYSDYRHLARIKEWRVLEVTHD